MGTAFEARASIERTVDGQAYPSQTTQRWTLESKADGWAVVRVETVHAGRTTPITVKIHLADEAQREAGQVLEERPETITVEAGEFACTYRKVQVDAETVVEEWIDPALPVPCKSVVVEPGAKTETELVRVDAK